MENSPIRVAVIITISLCMLGCQKPTDTSDSTDSISTTETPSSSSETQASIDPGRTVTEEDQQAMLAAKESLFKQLSQALMDAMTSGGPADAIEVCHQKAPELAAVVSQQHGLKIGRTGVRLRNPNNSAPAWAKELTTAKTDTPQFVMLDNGSAAALLPIKLQAQCLMCHGPADQIIPEIKAQLAKYYPEDQATGFQEGELRGWFWVEKPAG